LVNIKKLFLPESFGHNYYITILLKLQNKNYPQGTRSFASVPCRQEILLEASLQYPAGRKYY